MGPGSPPAGYRPAARLAGTTIVRDPTPAEHGLSCCGRSGYFCIQRFEQGFDPAARNTPRNEDDPAATVVGRPVRQPGGWMKDVLNAVDDRRLVGALQDIDDALEPQEIGTAMLRESLKKEALAPQPGS